MAAPLDSELVILACIHNLTGVKAQSISACIEHGTFTKIISKICKNVKTNTSFKDSIPQLQSTIKEYFVWLELVDYSAAQSGNTKELSKMFLLLLYISFITDRELWSHLSTPHEDQLKLKYLFECIQKKSSGLRLQFLDILITESLDNRTSSSSASSPSGLPPIKSKSSSSRVQYCSTSTVYTSSPVGPSPQYSPLKELIQSPQFRIQRKLESRIRDVNRLNREVNALENEKADLLLAKEVSDKRLSKLEREVMELKEKHLKLQNDRDQLESLVVVGKDESHMQSQKLGRELASVRNNYATLEQTLKEVMDKNDELTSQLTSRSSRLEKLIKEKEELESDVVMLREQQALTLSNMDEKEHILQEQIKQIQELENCLQAARQKSKPFNLTIESDNSILLGNIAEETRRPVTPSNESQPEENMQSAVVDLLLQEKEQKLRQLEEEFSAEQLRSSELRQRCTEQEERINRLQAQVQSSTERVYELQTQLEDAKTQLLESTHHAQGLTSQLEDMVNQRFAAEKEYTDRLNAVQAEHKESTEQLKKALYEQVTALEMQLSSSNAENDKLNNRCALLTSQVTDSTAQLEQQQLQLQCVQRQLEEKSQIMDSFKRNAEQEVAVLNKRLEDNEKLMKEIEIQSRREMTEIREHSSAKENEARLAKESFSRLQDEIEKLRTSSSNEITKLTGEKEELIKRLSAVEKNVDSVNSQLKRAVEEREMLKNETQQQLASNEQKHEENLLKLKADLADKEKSVLEAKQSADELFRQLEVKTKDLKDIEEKMNKEKRELEDEKNNLRSTLKERENTLQVNEQRFKEKVLVLESSRSLHEKKLFEVEACIKTMTEENATLQRQLNETKQQNQTLQASLKSYQEQMIKEKLDIAQGTKKSEADHATQIAALQEELERKSIELSKQTQEIQEQAQKEVDNLRASLKQLRETLKSKTMLVTELQESSIVKDDKITHLNDSLEKLQSDLAAMIRQQEDNKNNFTTEKEQVHRRWRNEQDKLIAKISSLEQALSVKDSLVAKCSGDIENLKSEISKKQQLIFSITQHSDRHNVQHTKELEDARRKFNDELAVLEREFDEKVRNHELEFNEKISSLTVTIKEKESLVLSLMDSVEEKKNTLAQKENEFTANIKNLQTKHNEELGKIKSQFEKERSEFHVNLKEISDKLSRTESDLLFKEEVMVQKATSDQQSKKKCQELQNCLKELEQKHALALSECAKNVELAEKDLAVLKRECTQLHHTLQAEKNAHMETVKKEREARILEVKKINERNDLMVKNLNARSENMLKEKQSEYVSLKFKYDNILKSHDEEIAKTNQVLSNIQTEKLNLEKMLEQTSNSLENLKEMNNFKIQSLEAREQDLTCSQEQMKREHANTVSTYEAKVKECQDTITRVSDEKKALADAFAEKERDLTLLNNEILQKNKLIESTKQELEAVKKEMGIKCTEVLELKSLVNQLNTKLDAVTADKNRAITNENITLEKMNSLINDRDMEIIQLNEKIEKTAESLETERKDHNSEIAKIKEEMEANINDLNSKLNEEIRNTSEMQKVKQELENQKKQALELAAELESKCHSLKHSLTVAENKKSNLEMALSECSNHEAELGVQVLKLEEQNKVLKQTLEERLTEAKEENKMLSSIAEENKTLKSKVEQMSSELKLAQNTLSRTNADHSSLIKEKEDKENELSACKKELQKMNDRLLEVEATLIDKDKQCSAAEEEVMRVERVAENDIRSLKEEIAGLKQKYNADKQTYMDKIKGSVQGHIEKFMAEREKVDAMLEEEREKFMIIANKYEASKLKLTQKDEELEEAKSLKEKFSKELNKYKEYSNKLRESLNSERLQRVQAEKSSEPLKAELQEANALVKQLQMENKNLEVQRATADCRIREFDRTLSRQSLAGPMPAPSLRSSEPQLSTANSRSTRSTRSSNLDSTPPGAGSRRTAATRGLTNSYRKAVGRTHSSTRAPSSSTEEDVLDSSDVPLLQRSTRSNANTSALNSSRQAQGVFRKPSLRLVSAEGATGKPKVPVELRALTSYLGDDCEDEENWESGEKKFMIENKNKTLDERHRRASQVQPNNRTGRRMTVDGRIIKDEESIDSPADLRSRRNTVVTRSVPKGMGNVFSCEDEDQEFFSNKYLQEMKSGKCDAANVSSRVSELHRRNSLYPRHMRSVYAPELFPQALDEELDSLSHLKGLRESDVKDLTNATERLAIESPAFNLRKRKSLSGSLASLDSLNTSLTKKPRRLSTSYSKPGPPTPARRSIGGRSDKENRRISLRSSQGSPSTISTASSGSVSSRRVSQGHTVTVSQPISLKTTPKASPSSRRSSRGGGATPVVANTKVRRGHHTPASIKRLMKGKSPWKKLHESASEDTGRGVRTGARQHFTERLLSIRAAAATTSVK